MITRFITVVCIFSLVFGSHTRRANELGVRDAKQLVKNLYTSVIRSARKHTLSNVRSLRYFTILFASATFPLWHLFFYFSLLTFYLYNFYIVFSAFSKTVYL